MKNRTRELLAAQARDKRELWNQFRHDHEFIERLRITPDEVKMLERCALLGTLTCKQDLLFILRQIREAIRPITPDKIAELKPAARGVSSEEPASRVVRTRLPRYARARVITGSRSNPSDQSAEDFRTHST